MNTGGRGHSKLSSEGPRGSQFLLIVRESPGGSSPVSILAPPKGWGEKALLLVRVRTKTDRVGAYIFILIRLQGCAFLKQLDF